MVSTKIAGSYLLNARDKWGTWTILLTFTRSAYFSACQSIVGVVYLFGQYVEAFYLILSDHLPLAVNNKRSIRRPLKVTYRLMLDMSIE